MALVALSRQLRASEGTFVPGWSVRRVRRLTLVLCAGALAVGLLAAPVVDLGGPLVAGPCCALLTGRWIRTAATALFALVSAVVVSLVADGTELERIAFVVAVGLAAGTNTVAAAWILRRLER